MRLRRRPLCRTFGRVTPPNPEHTPLRSFRIPDPLYRAAQARAFELGETVTDVVRRALEEYVAAK